MKKLIISILALAMVFGTMTVGAFADEPIIKGEIEQSPELSGAPLMVTPVQVGQPFEPINLEEGTYSGYTSYEKFDDVEADDWFADAVTWAVLKSVTLGTDKTHFSPNLECTRGQFVTFLWRASGAPIILSMTEEGTSAENNPFSDVDKDDYYYHAVVWANVRGIVTGTSETTFAPNAKVTREQIAAILYRLQKKNGADVSVGEETNILSYDDAFDISEYAIPAVQWAVGAGIINGVSDTKLAPKATATRAQIVTMLYRLFVENQSEDVVVLPGFYSDVISQRATAEITEREEAGVFDIQIMHGDSAAVTYIWELTAELQGNRLVYQNGVEKKYEYSIPEGGTDPVETVTVIKDDLSGYLEVDGFSIFWTYEGDGYTNEYQFINAEHQLILAN